MPRGKTKAGPKLLMQWILALSSVLAVMIGIALFLKPEEPSRQAPPPETTHPTTSTKDYVYDKNGFLSCTTKASIPGIDVSHHQGQIDWAQVKASGIEFAIIRLGYRGYQDGKLHVDEQVEQNLTGAKAAGLKIGAYIFSQATNTAEAVEEAQFALQILGETSLDLPLVYDWEYISDSARTAHVDGDTLMACVRAFCGEAEQAGFEPMVYFNQDLAKTKLDLEALQYPFWLAMYSDSLRFAHEVRCWQYTDSGSVPGIHGNVDIDLYFP